MPWPRSAVGTSVWVKVMTPGAQSVIGDRDLAAGIHLEPVLGFVVADGVGHWALGYLRIRYT